MQPVNRALRWVVVAALLYSLPGCGGKGMTAEKLDAELKRSVPVGTDHARVGAILDSLKIEHSPYDQRTRAITAIVRDVSRTATTRRSLQVNFTFDDAGRLVGHTVKEVFTGP